MNLVERSPVQRSTRGAYVGSVTIRLVEASRQMLDADLAGLFDELGDLLHVHVDGWPPVDGEWDQAALRYFRTRVEEADFDPGWGPHYVTFDGRLVASAGFFGPPNKLGQVEIGYSVCLSERRKGIATATVHALCEKARARGAVAVIARTTPTNTGSLRTLERNRFAVVHSPPDATGDIVILRRSFPSNAESHL